jgi:hypothetical protein
MRSVPPRLRGPLAMLIGGAVLAAIVVPGHGWGALVFLWPFTVVFSVAWYLWGGRDSDFGALIRDRPDERQAQRRLKTQALVGAVMSGTAVVVYLAALAAKVPLWPLDIFLIVPAVTFIIGWAIYREPRDDRDEGPATESPADRLPADDVVSGHRVVVVVLSGDRQAATAPRVAVVG